MPSRQHDRRVDGGRDGGTLLWHRQRVPPRVPVPGLAAVAVLGFSIPLLGVPLAAFLAVDVVLGEIGHRRGTLPRRAG